MIRRRTRGRRWWRILKQVLRILITLLTAGMPMPPPPPPPPPQTQEQTVTDDQTLVED